MKKLRTRSVFDGGPVTTENIDKDGSAIITVQAKTIGPKGAQFADLLSCLIAGGTAIIGIGSAILLDESSLFQRSLMASAVIPAYFLSRHVLYELFSRTKLVRFTKDAVSFRRRLRTHNFDTDLPHKWVLHPHPKVGLEARKLEVKKAKRDLKKSVLSGFYFKPFWEPYLGNSRVVSFEYMGQRNDLMKAKSLEQAQELISRLTAVSEVVAGRKNSGDGVATSPNQEWGKQAGGLILEHERSVS